MTDRTIGTSPQTYARVGGVLYLIIIAIGLFGEAGVRGRVIVSGDAASTAAKLRTMESLWRFHIAAELVLLICAVIVTWILFFLLKPVSKELVLLSVLFNLVSIGIEAVSTMYLIVALFPLGKAGYLKAFTPEQLYALAYLAVKPHGYGFGVSLIFFGCFCVVIGYLIFRSGYFPKAIGILMQIAGVCYLINSFTLIAAPALADRLFPAILIPSFVGELSFALYLTVQGVNVAKWRERAGALAS
ncbi:MAG TPA: DUF4386 domain-containing protein [Terriglobales bacterium]|nr:DUF4386 domain-containing protein [Terriglobales bacterium]